MTIRRPTALLFGVPLAFSVLLWFHPMVSDYEGLRGVGLGCWRSGCTSCSAVCRDGRPPSPASP